MADLLDGRLPDAAHARAAAHADDCERCRTLLVECVRADRAADHGLEATAPCLPGGVVGRYVLLAPLGRGGMAAVYRAYDPELQRQVAVKMMPAGSPGDDGRDRERLLREAQALARIAHPNVVHVFDVGLHRGGVFITMELLGGAMLNVWQEQQRPSRQRLRAVLVGVGRGLAALHEAGLVHRDVKPSNVIVGDDDVPRLIDLGLALGAASDPAPGTSHSDAVPATARPGNLTAAGRFSGTPAYMAPEQLVGGPVTAATDQFSFCVMVHELLFGGRPFPGTSFEELRDNVLAGALRPAPRGRLLERRAHRAVVRGLARDPAARFPSIDALLAELVPRPMRIALGATAALALTGLAGGTLAGYLGSPSGAPTCPGDTTGLARVWSAGRRLALIDAMLATGGPRAPDTIPRVVARIDDYATRWLEHGRAACAATRIAGTQSEALLDRRTACLDRRLGALASLLDELTAHADAEVVDHAVAAVAALPDLDGCDDVTALIASTAEAHPAAAELDRIDALISTAQHARGLELGAELAARADRDGDVRTAAASHYRLGDLRARVGDTTAAQRELEAALIAAARAQDDELIAQCWILLVAVRGIDQGHHELGVAFGLAADAAIARTGEPWRLRVMLDNNLGNLATNHGEFGEARDRHSRALALNEQHRGPAAPETATSLSNLGNALDGLGALAEARTAHERALAIRRRALGDRHPYIAASLSNLAGTLRKLGALPLALERLDEALAVARQSLGPHHVGVAIVLGTMGNVLRDLARYTEARGRYTEALAITRAALPAGHPMVLQLVVARGEAAAAAGLDATARDDLEAAVSAMTGANVDPREAAASRFALARVLRRLGRDPARARALAVAARTTYAAAQNTTALAEVDRWLAGRAP